MTKIKAIFFDCWNTLINYVEQEKDHFIKLIYDNYIDEESKQKENVTRDEFVDNYHTLIYPYIRENDTFELTIEQEVNYAITYSRLKLRNGVTLNQACEICSRCFTPTRTDNIDKLIAYCRENNIDMYVLSNTEYSYNMTYNHIISCYDNKFPFDGLLVSSDVGVKKPSPLFFNLGLIKYGYKKDEVIYVGDNFFADVYGSNCAGFVNSIFYNPKKKEIPSYIKEIKNIEPTILKYIEINDYLELIDLLKEGKI